MGQRRLRELKRIRDMSICGIRLDSSVEEVRSKMLTAKELRTVHYRPISASTVKAGRVDLSKGTRLRWHRFINLDAPQSSEESQEVPPEEREIASDETQENLSIPSP